LSGVARAALFSDEQNGTEWNLLMAASVLVFLSYALEDVGSVE
jgi:hypothetical protein